jgi:secreted trypsin-like serine protease
MNCFMRTLLLCLTLGVVVSADEHHHSKDFLLRGKARTSKENALSATNATVIVVNNERRTGSRIVGGDLAPAGAYPSFVSGNGCGATLIHNDIIMTAAHCNGSPFTGTVRIGGRKADGSDSESNSCDFQVQHPKYSSRTNKNDIMIVKLKRASTAPLQALNFNQAIPYANQEEIAIGFGATTEGGSYYGDLLQVKVNAVSSTTCNKQLGGGIDPVTMICAGVPKGGKDTCQGDSGGPLYVIDGTNKTQVGITSFGYGCGVKNSPGVYAKVSNYEEWLKNMICGYTTVTPRPSYCTGRPVLARPVTCPCGLLQVSCRIRYGC